MGKALKPLIIGIIIGVVGLYAYQNPEIRSQISDFVGEVLNSVSEAPAPAPTPPAMVALPEPSATPTQVASTQVTPVPTATPSPSPTATPEPEQLPTATPTLTPMPTPVPPSYSIEVVSMKALEDGQVDFMLEVKNDQVLEDEIAQLQMSVDGGAPELVNIIANLPPGESTSFAFARTFDPGSHAIKFSVGDSHTTVNVNVDADGNVSSKSTPTPTVTPMPEPTVAATIVPTPIPVPTEIPVPANTPIPTQTPVPPTRTPAHTPIPPSPTSTPESEGLVSRFFKSARDLTEANDSSQPDIDVGTLGMLVHNLINRERAQKGLATLYWDSAIAEIARNHSLDMGTENYFSHVNPSGQNASDRGSSAGYDCIKDYGSYYTSGLAENIHQGWLYSSITVINGVSIYNWISMLEIADRAVGGWMRSAGHRKNILKDTYDKTGIGIAITSEGKVFITQNFC